MKCTKFIRSLNFCAPIIVGLISVVDVGAQSSINQSLEFVQLPVTALQSGMGGVNVSLADRDVNLFMSNPALNSDSLNGWAGANYLFYFANVGMANFACQFESGKLGPVSVGVQHLALGSIQGYDPSGNPTSEYQSGETAVVVAKSHELNHFRLGVSLKGVVSSLAGYRASSLMFDLGGVFVHPHQDFTAGLVIKSVGFLLSDFTGTSATRLPFDIQVGTTFKPQHMPVRFSFTAYQLSAYRIAYNTVDAGTSGPSSLEKVLRHFNFGAEVLVHRHVNVLLGYNFQRHAELQLPAGGGGAGFSVGMVAKVKAASLAISRTGYASGGSYQVSLNASLSKWFKHGRL